LAARLGANAPVGVDLPDIDFVALAAGHGCDGVRRCAQRCASRRNAGRVSVKASKSRGIVVG